MLTRLHSPDRDDDGFTLIELLAVIIIIGILSAIAIPIFLNQRKKGIDASLKSDLKALANAQEAYIVDNTDKQGYFNNSTSWTITGAPVVLGTNGPDFVPSPGNTLIASPLTAANSGTGKAEGYCLQATNPNGTDPTNGFFWISTKGGQQKKGVTTC